MERPPQSGHRSNLRRWPVTAADASEARDAGAVLAETLEARNSERQGRLIDHDSLGAMERKKEEGYF